MKVGREDWHANGPTWVKGARIGDQLSIEKEAAMKSEGTIK
jgi:acetamidase/formamidase